MPSQRTLNLITIIIGAAYFIEWVDAYALNTCFFTIARAFHVQPIHMKEALTLYFLSLGFFIPLGSWLVNRKGIKSVYIAAIIIFLIGSLGCAFANSAITLIVFRVIQGAGGAFLAPTGRLIMIKSFGKGQIIHAMSRISLISSVGMVIGPLLGGAFSTWLNWRWLFVINLPIGLAAILLIHRHLPNFTRLHKEKRLDWLGFILLGFTLAFVLLTLDSISDTNIAIHMKLISSILAVSLSGLYLLHTKRCKQPLFNPCLFSPSFNLPLVASLIIRLGISAPLFLVPLFLQNQMHYTPFIAGLFLLPTAITVPLGKLGLMRMINKHRLLTLYTIPIVNSVLFFTLAWLTYHFIATLVALVMLLYGLVMSMQVTTVNQLIYQPLPEALYSDGVTCNSAIIQLGACFAIAISGLVLLLNGISTNSSHVLLTSHAYFMAFAVAGCFPLAAMPFIKAANRHSQN